MNKDRFSFSTGALFPYESEDALAMHNAYLAAKNA